MTFSKEDLSKAFEQALCERVPELGDIPDHVFSERFEKRMEKLLRREAAHPWAVSHTAARNLLVAALIAILLFALSLSVSGIRNAIYNFFTRHFDTYDEVVFDDTGRTEIEHVYEITSLPEGFVLEDSVSDKVFVSRVYKKSENAYIVFSQMLPSMGRERSIDNERTKMKIIHLENQIFYYTFSDSIITLAWEKDGYEFWLEMLIPHPTLEQAIQIYSSIQ